MPYVIPFIIYAAEAIATWATTTTILGVSIATIAVDIAASVGISLLSEALFGPKAPQAQAMKQVIRQAVAPRRRSYGRVRDGGVLAFLHDRDGFLYQLIMAQQGEIDGFEGHYLAGTELTLNAEGFSTAPPNYNSGSDYSFVYVETRNGSAPSAAYAALTSGFSKGDWSIGGFPEVCDSTFRLDGIATTLLILRSPSDKSFTAHFPVGLPAYMSKRRGCKVWDPTDSSQIRGVPATYKWTMNGPAIVLDLITHPDGMLRIPDDMIMPALDVWKAQIAGANTTRALKNGGSEPWYQLSGTYSLTDQPKQLLPQLLVPMDARLYLRADGAVSLDIGQWVEPGLTIDDSQIVSYSGLSRGRQQGDIRNEFRARYVSPDHLFTEQEADPLLNEASIDVDGYKSMTLDCTWSPSHAQTRFRMKIEKYRQDPDGWCGQIVTTAYGLQFLTPEVDGRRRRNIRFQIAELGIDDTFEVQNFGFDVNTGNCTFSVIAMSEAAFTWNAAADEGTAPALPNAISDSGVEDPDSLTVNIQPTTLSGGVTSAKFVATMPAPVQANLNTVLQQRVSDNSVSDEDADWFDFTITGTGRGYFQPLAENTYDVRGAWRNHKQELSDYIYVRGLQVVYGRASANLDHQNQIEELSRAVYESAASASSDALDIRQTLSANYTNLQADYTSQIARYAGPGSATVQRIETLEAALAGVDGSSAVASALSSLTTAVNANTAGISANSSAITSISSTVGAFSASGYFDVNTHAALNGADATIAIGVSATSGGAPATAALFLSAMSDGSTQVQITADQFIVHDGTNFHQPLSFSGGVLTVDNAIITNLQTSNLGANAATINHNWTKENLLGYGNNVPYVEFAGGENIGQPIELIFSGYIEGARSSGSTDGYLIARVMRTTNAAKVTSQVGQNALWSMDTGSGAYIAALASSADGWTAISGSGTTVTTNAQYLQLSGSGSLGSYMGMQKSSMSLSYNRLHLRLSWASASSVTSVCYGLRITFGSTVVCSQLLNPGLGGFVGFGFPFSDFDIDLVGAPGGTGTIKVELEYDGAGTNTAKIDELIFGTYDGDVVLLDELVIGKTSGSTTLPEQFSVPKIDAAPPTSGSGAYVGYAIYVAYVQALTDVHNKSSWNGSFNTAIFRNAVLSANQIKR